MSEDVGAELRRLLDRQAIADCVNRYARGLDRHDDPYPDGTWDRTDLSYRRPLVVGTD